MKFVLILALGAFVLPASVSAQGKPAVIDPLRVLFHGGGCRKSSPPGQCCHMDNKAGKVHCH